MKPITTTNYYRLTVRNLGEFYEFGNTAEEAIATVRNYLETPTGGHPHRRPLGAVSGRKAVLGEWKRELTHGGQLAR